MSLDIQNPADAATVRALLAQTALADPYFRLSSKADDTFTGWRERSIRQAAANYADTAGSEFSETWANLNAWSAAAGVQVSNNTLVTNSGNGTNGGINHAFVIAAGAKARIVIPYHWAGNASGGGLLIGVSNDAPGATGTVNGAGAKGIYFSLNGVSSFDLGSITSIASNLATGTNYDGVVTISIDANYISVVALITGQATEYRAKFPRSGFNINNIYLLVTSSFGAVKPLAARYGMSTTTPTLNVERVERAVQVTTIPTLSGTANIKVVTPAGYDSRIPTPAVIMFHGNGSNENLFSDNAGQQPAYLAFLNAGYIVVSASDASSGSTWGAQKSLDAYYAAAQFLRDNYSVSSLGIYANSMGGIESELALARRYIPGIKWWIGQSPTYNLADCYAPQPGFISFGSTINSAYGVSSYTAIPAGFDPATLDPRAFRGLPMMILAASDDASVNPVNNGIALGTAVGPYAPELIIVPGITGGHSFPLNGYTAQMISFANRYSGV